MLDDEFAGGFALLDDHTWASGISSWSEAAAHLGAVEAASHLRARILAYHDQLVTTDVCVEPALCHCLGRLDHVTGDYDAAEQWFAEAIEIHQRVRAPVLVAQTQAAWAEMLADRNQRDDHDRARTMAHSALDAATVGGYGYIEADARAVLDRLSYNPSIG